MKNEHGKEEERLLSIFAKNGVASVCKDSALDSVVAVYGSIITSSEMKDLKVEICVNKDTSVEILNVEENATMMFWMEDLVDEDDSVFLLYVLSEEVEFLLYKSCMQAYDFHMASVPAKRPDSDGIIRRVEVLPQFKVYRVIQKMLFDRVTHPYKNKYEFVFDPVRR